jgi:exodeoxyribonuclease VIII
VNPENREWIGEFELSNSDYHQSPGISSSTLQYLDESVNVFENRHLFKSEGDHFLFGSMVHKLILEKQSFFDEFAIMPSFDARTKEGKAGKAEFLESNPGKNIVTFDDFETAEKMAFNVSKIAGGILQDGIAERSFYSEVDGLLLKCRPDYYIKRLGLVIDVKTTNDISEFGMRKSITNYKYHWSAVFYLKVLQSLGLDAQRFLFIFVEKTAPHMVKIREISKEGMEAAETEVEDLLDKYRQYKLTGKASLFKQITPFSFGA